MTQGSEPEVATAGERLSRGMPGLEWLRGGGTEERMAFVRRRSIRSYGITCSCSLAVVIIEQPSQSLLTLNRSLTNTGWLSLPGKQQLVLFALMITFFMIMHSVLLKRLLQGRLSEENQLREAVLFDRSHPALRIGIQVGTPGW